MTLVLNLLIVLVSLFILHRQDDGRGPDPLLLETGVVATLTAVTVIY
jgi:hypothetical protein